MYSFNYEHKMAYNGNFAALPLLYNLQHYPFKFVKCIVKQKA